MAPRRPHLHAPWGAWPLPLINIFVLLPFQLTRSVGSVTFTFTLVFAVFCISTHTLRGERDIAVLDSSSMQFISTHTLRGERDHNKSTVFALPIIFQLTRSVGSVTWYPLPWKKIFTISTHTLRGERDFLHSFSSVNIATFQLTRSVGSVTFFVCIFFLFAPFQLTRSVGSVTCIQTINKKRSKISTHTLRGERDKHQRKQQKQRRNFNSHAPWGAWQ